MKQSIIHNRRLARWAVAVAAALLATLTACRDDDVVFIPETVPVSQPEYTSVSGFYLLNEGNMGSNKSTLDYYDYATGRYTRNIYANANPTVPKEMGDVGNDAGIYGSRLYCVINCSNKVEVMDRDNCRRIGQINIPNCRFIKFYGGYAYVTSYAGPVVIDPNYKQRGYVAKVDTATLEVVDTCVVGFQPDQLDIAGGKIYVANSGGYMVPNYENTLSVIDLATFKEEARIPIAINLLGVVADRRGVLWVTSRGDYYSNPSDIYAYDTRKGRIVKRMDCRASSCWMDGDSLYVVSSDWSYVTGGNAKPRYQIINTLTMQVVDTCFIKDGTDGKIEKPYGVAVNPITKDIMVADAKDYVSPGRLYCFGPDGQMKWNVRTGDIPAHFVFLGRNENEH